MHDDGRWRARGRIDEVELPDSVQAVILARLDLLTPDERRVAQRAAVVGRLFWDGALAAVGGADDLDAMLRTLRRREFVVERVSSTFAGEREFVFKHVLIRDVAYESLPRGERGRAHVEAAEWIERALALAELSELRPGVAGALLVRGRIEASRGEPERARDSLLRAAEIFRELGHEAELSRTRAALAALSTH